MEQKQNALQQQERRVPSRKEYLDGIQKKLAGELTAHAAALPRDFNRERFVLNCVTLIQDMMRDPKQQAALQKVNANTIPVCMAKGAYLGLDFFNGECYAIPYGNTMTFQTDYKGEIKLCKKYSRNPIKDIYAKLVREGDYFEESVSGGVQNVVFRPVPFSDKDIIGAFAVVLFVDGSMMYDTMSRQQIDDVREHYSKAKNSPAWQHSYGEMCKKTVLRRLCKLIDLDFDSAEQRAAFDEAGDANFKSEPIVVDSGDGPVDVFAQDTGPQEGGDPVTGDTPEDQRGPSEEEYAQYERRVGASGEQQPSLFGSADPDDPSLPWN